MTTLPADPAAIDLDTIWSQKPGCGGVRELIAAVEALRARLAWLERQRSAETEVGVKERIEHEALRERVTDLTRAAGAAHDLLSYEQGNLDEVLTQLETVLATIPAKALEQARAEFTWEQRVEGGEKVWRCQTKEAAVELWPRPHYCDRGRWQAHMLCNGYPVNPNPFDAQDGFPRYYFSLERAKAEIEDLFTFRGCELQASSVCAAIPEDT